MKASVFYRSSLQNVLFANQNLIFILQKTAYNRYKK